MKNINLEAKKLLMEIKFQTGMTQAEIAEKIGSGRSYLSDVASGRVSLTDEMRDKLTALLGNDNSREAEWVPDETSRGIPLLPLLAQGGKLNDFVTSVADYDCERIISPIHDAELALTVSGESMAPEYPAGSVVLVKKIDETKFIEWGRAYIIDTANGVVIKYLAPSEKGEGFIRCVSLNPAPHYAPFDVNLEDVYGIYRVMLCMSIK